MRYRTGAVLPDVDRLVAEDRLSLIESHRSAPSRRVARRPTVSAAAVLSACLSVFPSCSPTRVFIAVEMAKHLVTLFPSSGSRYLLISTVRPTVPNKQTANVN